VETTMPFIPITTIGFNCFGRTALPSHN